jgi:hypothetical protein
LPSDPTHTTGIQLPDTTFKTSEFVASGKPWDYIVDSGLCEPEWSISDLELEALLRALDTLDEVHLAFALAIAENSQPEIFGLEAARLLGHSSLSVRLKSYRVLRAISVQHLTSDLRNAVDHGLMQCPEKEHFDDALSRP